MQQRYNNPRFSTLHCNRANRRGFGHCRSSIWKFGPGIFDAVFLRLRFVIHHEFLIRHIYHLRYANSIFTGRQDSGAQFSNSRCQGVPWTDLAVSFLFLGRGLTDRGPVGLKPARRSRETH